MSPVRPPRSTGLDELRRWAVLLDSAFKVPGTNVRFGLDAIIGLVPGLGDLVAPVYTLILLGTALKMRVPAVVVARMVLNAGIDMLLGLVPFAGDVADVFWKADLRNIALLERHARPGRAADARRLLVRARQHRRGRRDWHRADRLPHLAADAVLAGYRPISRLRRATAMHVILLKYDIIPIWQSGLCRSPLTRPTSSG